MLAIVGNFVEFVAHLYTLVFILNWTVFRLWSLITVSYRFHFSHSTFATNGRYSFHIILSFIAPFQMYYSDEFCRLLFKLLEFEWISRFDGKKEYFHERNSPNRLDFINFVDHFSALPISIECYFETREATFFLSHLAD